MKVKILVILSFFLLSGIANLFGFCIHNETKSNVLVNEYSGGSYKGVVLSGEVKCCSWNNKMCNSEGKKDSIIKVSIVPNKKENYFIIAKGFICNKAMRADAHLYIKENNGKTECVVYDK